MSAPDVEVAIVGTGFSGLGMAIQLQKANRSSFVLLEKAGEVGGTWRDNHYPGCACDIPSHLYSFSFEPNPRWSRMFATQPEIFDYLRRCADKYNLRPKIRFHCAVERIEFDDREAFWRISIAGGATLTARYVVLGIGPLSRPTLPSIPGLETFAGKRFHSTEWDHRYDLDGKTVAVIGTGASAIQFVPEVAQRAKRLHLFQRTPPWVLPRPDRAISPREQRLFSGLPIFQQLYRYWIYWLMEWRAIGFSVDPRIMKLVALAGRQHIRKHILDPSLQKALTPTYLPGCKRILMSNDYYPALARSNVEVVTSELVRAGAETLVTRDGAERKVDAIIFGTGFRVSEYLTPIEVRGRDGTDLNTRWRERTEAYLGTTVAGFPNFFTLLGPNTALGHNSVVFMMEAQLRHVLDCMRASDAHEGRPIEVRQDAQRAFNESLEPRLRRAVWASGCQSWYLDAEGKNIALWPGFTVDFWRRTLRLKTTDYSFDEVE